MRDTLIYWGRWLAVLPAAVLAYGAAAVVVGLVGYLWSNSGNDPVIEMPAETWGKIWRSTVLTAATAYAFVRGGSYVAPDYKEIVGLVLGILLFMASGMVIGLVLLGRSSDPIWGVVSLLANAVGAAIAVGQGFLEMHRRVLGFWPTR